MIYPYPFSFTYKKKLSRDIDIQESLKAFDKEIRSHSVEDVVVENKKLHFSVPFFRLVWNWNLMSPVDFGQVEFIEVSNQLLLEYKISVFRFFFIVLGMSILFGVISKNIYVGIICFVVMGFINWLLAFNRHKLFFEKLYNLI